MVDKHRIIIFSHGRNCANYIKKHMASINRQNYYKEYIHIIVDDNSDDTTLTEISKYAIEGHDIVHKNMSIKGWLSSAVNYINLHIVNINDIIVIVDLYDWLADPEALNKVEEAHISGCWLTYGGFTKSTLPRNILESKPMRDNIINKRSFRRSGRLDWRFYPLISFRAFLWFNISTEGFITKKKTFYEGCYKDAIGFPLMEMTPPSKVHYFNDVNYVMNTEITRSEQHDIFKLKPSYNMLPLDYPDRIANEKLDSDKFIEIGNSNPENQFFIIFSCGWNCQGFVKRHMDSINNQTYKNFVHIMVDDCSTDDTYKLIMANKGHRRLVYKNKTNNKWLHNSVLYLKPNIKNDNMVVVILDMDDWLANNFVLDKLNSIYSNEKCWTTYGSCRAYEKPNIIMPKGPAHMEILESRRFRDCGWYYTHLKTFKGFLYKNIDERDFKDHDTGEWIKYSYDRFLMFPILEMCPPEKIRYIHDILCIYNITNANSVSKTNRDAQIYYKELAPRYKRYNLLKWEETNNETIFGWISKHPSYDFENDALLVENGP